MNRFLILITLVLTVSFSSCMKSSDYEVSPVAAGVNIYGFVDQTNTFALDPVNVAIRLNILLHEASLPGAAEKLEDIVVKKGDTEINVKDKLFGYATINPTGEGVYTIKYPEGYTLKGDFPRRGSIIIDTNGKTLYDNESTMWEVTMATGTDKPFIYNPTTSNIYFGSSTYSLSGQGGSISVSGLFDGYMRESEAASWSLESDIEFGEARGYLSVIEAEKIELGFDAYGTLMGTKDNGLNNSSMNTNYSTLKYKPSCKDNYGNIVILAGEITAKCPILSSTYPQDYPSDKVEIVWTNKEGQCASSVAITYNGITETR